MLPTGVDEIVYCGYLANYWIGFTFFEFYCGKSLFGFARAMAVSLLFGFGWMVYAGLDFNGRELRCNCTSALWLRHSACPEVYLIEETLFMWTTLHVTLGAPLVLSQTLQLQGVITAWCQQTFSAYTFDQPLLEISGARALCDAGADPPSSLVATWPLPPAC